MRILLLLIAFGFFVNTPSAQAQSNFVKYKKYLIPIGGSVDTTSPQCIGLSATEENVVYIDDLGREDQDQNGFQDLAVVLGLSNKFNLLAIGVGVPGKREGLRHRDIKSSDVAITLDWVNATKIANKPSVLSGSALVNKVKDYANCSSRTNKLIIATGGLWHDVAFILDADESINDKIRVVGITGSNISSDPNFHRVLSTESQSARAAYQQVIDAVGDVEGIADAEYRPFVNEQLPLNNSLSALYAVVNRPLARDDKLTILPMLRLVDYGSVVLALNLVPREDIYNSSVILPLINEALKYAATGN